MHLIGSALWYAACAETGRAPASEEAPDVADADIATAYADATDRALAAFGVEGIADAMIAFPVGPTRGAVVMSFAAVDAFTHGWDIAKATGQSTDIDPVLAVELLTFARRNIREAMRGTGGSPPFAPARDTPNTATRADRLAAYLGRIT